MFSLSRVLWGSHICCTEPSVCFYSLSTRIGCLCLSCVLSQGTLAYCVTTVLQLENTLSVLKNLTSMWVSYHVLTAEGSRAVPICSSLSRILKTALVNLESNWVRMTQLETGLGTCSLEESAPGSWPQWYTC